MPAEGDEERGQNSGKGGRAHRVHVSGSLLHFLGAVPEISSVQRDDGYGETAAQGFNVAEDERLRKKGIPEQDDGNVRQSLRQGCW